MRLSVAVAGKGGVGKTTVSALLVEVLRERGDGPILAVDADPNSNLGELLGFSNYKTIGSLREEILQRIADLPPGMSKELLLEQGLHECLVEGEGADLLVMGRGEGPRCYCMVNHILRKYIEALRKNYEYLVIDNEAGMEHLSRRTTQDVDILLLVAKPDPVSIRAALRIASLSQELELKIGKKILVLNDVGGEIPEVAERELKKADLELGGVVPHDEEIFALALEGRPIRELSPTSPAKKAVAKLVEVLMGMEGGENGDPRGAKKVAQ